MRNLFIVALMGICFSGCGSVAKYSCTGDFRNEVVCPGILDHLVEDAPAPAAKPAAPTCTVESGKKGWVVFRHCNEEERREYFGKK